MANHATVHSSRASERSEKKVVGTFARGGNVKNILQKKESAHGVYNQM